MDPAVHLRIIWAGKRKPRMQLIVVTNVAIGASTVALALLAGLIFWMSKHLWRAASRSWREG